MGDDRKSRRERQSQYCASNRPVGFNSTLRVVAADGENARNIKLPLFPRQRCSRDRGSAVLSRLPLLNRHHRCWLQYLASRFAVESWGKPLDVLLSMGNWRVVLSLASFIFLGALAVCASDQEPAEVTPEPSTSVESKWGSYDGNPVTKWNTDGRTMTLITELRYTDPQGVVWVALIGSVV